MTKNELATELKVLEWSLRAWEDKKLLYLETGEKTTRRRIAAWKLRLAVLRAQLASAAPSGPAKDSTGL